jgi:putative acetyltransferase
MFTIRSIQENDNAAIASIIRNALAEFGANKPGTVFFDPTTDHLFELFQANGAAYFIAVDEQQQIVGGCGIFPTAALPPQTCELVKMYLQPQVRGLGLGRQLIQHSMNWAAANGYQQVYLETMPELKAALKAYEKFGFHYLNGPMGNSGHFGCDVWMLRQLDKVPGNNRQ